MMIRDSVRLKSEIELIRKETRSRQVSHADGDRYAQLATIWVSGYLEASCREALLAYTRKRSEAARALRQYSKGDIKDSVDDIVESRHAVAHGRPVSITLENVFHHYDNVAKLTRKMAQLLA